MQLNPALRTPAQKGHLVLRIRTVFFVPGESPYIFFKVNPLNTDTRLSTLHCSVMSFLSEGKKKLLGDIVTMFQCYIAPERMICRRQFQTILASNELCREGFCFHGSIVSEFRVFP